MSELKDATIKCVIGGNKRPVFSLVFTANSKTMPIQNFSLPEASNGMNCSVETKKGLLVKIILDGKEYVKDVKPVPSHSSGQQHHGNRGNQGQRPLVRPQPVTPVLATAPPAAQQPTAYPAGTINPARAPYNFVPFDSKVIPGEPRSDHDRFYAGTDRESGYITLTIETKTPLYIRGTFTEEQAKQKVESKNLPEFFGPNGRLRIPGSSYRGMVRTLLEIVSWSALSFIDKDNHYFYRALADKSDSLNSRYQGKTATPFPRVKPLAKAGYLEKINGLVKLIPAIQHADFGNASIFRVNQQDILDAGIPDVLQMQAGNVINQDYKMSRQKIWYKPDDDVLLPGQRSTPDYHNHHGDLKMFYGTINAGNIQLDTPSDVAGWYKGWLICSGAMHNKKMHYVVADKDNSAHSLDVPPELLKLYKDDLSKVIKQGMHVLPEKDNGNDGNPVPCFYLDEQNNETTTSKVIAFGHTQFFRVPYKHKVGHFVRQKSLTNEHSDVATTIFGKISEDCSRESFPGRVSFEDADVTSHNNYSEVSLNQPCILGSPKPTTFNHYLYYENEAVTVFKPRPSMPVLLRDHLSAVDISTLFSCYDKVSYELLRSISRRDKIELLRILLNHPDYHDSFVENWDGNLPQQGEQLPRFKFQVPAGRFELLMNSVSDVLKVKLTYCYDSLTLNRRNNVVSGTWTNMLKVLARNLSMQDRFISKVSELHDWNADDAKISIRGHKLYWHRRNGNKWIDPVTGNDTDLDDHDQHTIIKPITEGVTFTGRIRFENLSKVELGALLFVLELPSGVDEELCHKLGMGKPLGLGSVKITPKLVTINRTERYRRLFDDVGLFRGENPQTSDDIPCLKKDFALYILRHLKGDSTYSPMDPVAELWNTPRLTQLRHLLNWKNIELPNWIDRTRYLEIDHPQNGNEYKMRRLLPSPQHVVESCHG